MKKTRACLEHAGAHALEIGFGFRQNFIGLAIGLEHVAEFLLVLLGTEPPVGLRTLCKIVLEKILKGVASTV